MINKTFYPTPVKLANKMANRIQAEAKFILEPSAGSGVLLDALKKRWGMNDEHRYYRSQYDHEFYAIEQDQELVATLRGKNYNVIAFDFLTYQPSNFFDAIIMNPPFDTGDKHLLKAIEIIRNGEIVCLLNKETIENAHTQTRKLLKNKLQELKAEITDLGQVFIDADRKTNVDVVMIYIKKETKVDGFDYWNELSKETYNNETLKFGGELTQHDQVEALVSGYNEVQKEIIESFKHLQRAFYFANGIASIFDENTKDVINTLENLDDPRISFYMASNKTIDAFRKNAWKQVFIRIGADKLMSRKVNEAFTVDLEKGSSIDFTVENIRGVVSNLMQDANKIIRESIVDVFEHLCQFDKKNKVWIEGWKTNSAYKVNKRIIVPWFIERTFGYFNIKYGYSNDQVIRDFDKCLCHLAGKKLDDIKTIIDSLKKRFDELRNGKVDDKFECESEFFDIRFYKKGTVHLKWKDEKLWQRFNMEAAKGKMWIGDDKNEEKVFIERLMIE